MFASLIASIYLLSNRALNVAGGAFQILFEGFWMGLLPESVYDAISEQSYGEGRKYTNNQHLDMGFHFWEDLAIRKYFVPKSRVLVAAAGGGREIIALARAGFEASGFECSRAMVNAGRRALADRGMPVTLDWAPPSVAPQMNAAPFDALIVGWNGYCYISPRNRRIEFMKSLRTQLRPGSPVLVSTAIRQGASRRTAWTARAANAIRICTFRSPVFEPGDTFSGRPKMHFSRRQLATELKEAGFSITAFYVWGGYGAIVGKS